MESRANEERKGKKRGKGESKWEKGMDRIRKDVEEGETAQGGKAARNCWSNSKVTSELAMGSRIIIYRLIKLS